MKIAVATLLGALGWTAPALAAEPVRPDVVLVTLDTCRADRIGAWGHTGATTASIDALAAQGRRYARAYSPVPLTIPAHSALFTSRSPASLGIHTNGGGLSEQEVTLAERLHDAGYATAASVGAYVTAGMWGFEQGFDAYFDTLGEGAPAERPADKVVDDILAWTDHQTTGAPRFVWVHLFDAHSPHVAPDGSSGDAYDAEIAFVDAQVGRLVQAFSDRPTLFVVVGDHGESLGEHGEQEHGLFVYDSTQHVPYLISGPGIEAETVDEPVSLVDVAPTVLAHLGLPALPDAEGRVAPGSPVAPIPMESRGLQLRFGLAPHRAVVDGPYKLVSVPRPELYDLTTDPGETRDLADEEPARVARMQALIGPAQPLDRGPPVFGDPQLLEQLGYVDADPVATSGALPDSKDHPQLVTAVERADALVVQGRPEEALQLLAQVHGEYPDVIEVTVRLADRLTVAGRAGEAVELIQDGFRRRPDSATLLEALASALAAAGRHPDAAEALAALARARPHVPGIHQRAFEALAAAPGSGGRAIQFGLAYLQDVPDDRRMAGRVGVVMGRHGQLQGARPLLEQAQGLVPSVLDVNLFLARLADEGGDPRLARRLLQEEYEAHPNSAAAVMALSMMMERTGEWEAQVQMLGDTIERAQAAYQTTGRRPEVGLGVLWALKARALMMVGRHREAQEAVDQGMATDPLPALRDIAAALENTP